MALNLDAILRIAAKVEGRDQVLQLNESITELGNKSEKTGEKVEKASKKGTDWKAVAGVTALVVSLTLATQSAVAFEAGIADVRKVVDGLDSAGALQNISNEILDLSRSLPITAAGFAEIYAAAGQSGIARQDLKEFSRLVTDVATAFGFTASEAGVSLSQIKTALNLTIPELGKLSDAMNYVENNTGATARGLVDFMTRSASVGKIAGLQATETIAFGAAMTQLGVDTEVAATSFNNMIKALSRGPSMTDRQVEALKKLGYEMSSAEEIEKSLTRQAESASQARTRAYEKEVDKSIELADRQAEERMRLAERETDSLLQEIASRYRLLQRQSDDAWEDQDIAASRAFDRRVREQVDLVEEQRRADLEVAKNQDQTNEETIRSINKSYDEKIELLRQNAEDERRATDRKVRDEREAQKNALDSKKRSEEDATREQRALQKRSEDESLGAYKQALKNKLETFKESESKILQEARDGAKRTGEEMAKNSGQAFADRLQEDATKTILEVLNKINSLPKSQQISVLSDLFGDEARGLAPLLGNLGELKRILSLVSSEQQYAGSTSEEASKRFETAASKIQIFNNRLENFKIVVGNTLLPILTGILEPIGAIIDFTSRVIASIDTFIRRFVILKALGAIAGSVIGPVISLTLAISGIMSLAQLTRIAGGIRILGLIPGPLRAIAIALTAIGVAATPLGPLLSALSTILLVIQAIRLGVTVAGWLGAIGPFSGQAIAALSPFLAWVTGTLLPTLVGVFSGPAGWIALALAALVTAAIVWREPIWDFLSWAGGAIAEWFEGIAAGATEFAGSAWKTAWDNDITNTVKNWVKSSIDEIKKFFGGIVEFVQENWIKNWQDLWTLLTRDPMAFVGNVRERFDDLVKSFKDTFVGAGAVVQNVFNSVSNTISRVWNWVSRGMANTLNAIIEAYNLAARAANFIRPNSLPVLTLITVPPEIPALAQGDWLTRPTLAMIGEGGDPGGEYAIPAAAMPAAMVGWAQGLRGRALVNAWQSPGPPASGGGGGGVGAPTLNLTIQQQGPTLQMPDGSQWVRREELAAVSQATMDGLMRLLGHGGVRSALGM